MRRRVLHGAVTLGVTLATVGALTASSGSRGTDIDGALAAADDAGGDQAVPEQAAADTPRPDTLRSEALDADAIELTPHRPDVPLRSGQLDDGEAVEAARPIAVRAAGIGLEASVIPVGVDADNQFDVPAADTVGWYRYSSSPGDPGASVLAAHVDYGGAPGAFFRLRDVLPGDNLEVVMDDGRTLVYHVTGNTQYDKTELPADELFRKDGSSVLQLITCGGSFDPAARSYRANVVVTAVPLLT